MSSTYRSSMVHTSNNDIPEGRRALKKTNSFTSLRSSSTEICIGRLKDAKKPSSKSLLQNTNLIGLGGSASKITISQSSFCLASLPELDQTITEGIQKFKANPRKGIEYLIEKGRIEDTPESIAKFLHEEDCDKDALGTYLSEESSADILKHYVASLDFDDMDFDLALRKFLTCFKLPGEAQKIDRFMKNFATRYYESHRGDNVFKNEISVYAMSFGTIMLNTDAHNEHVQYKMTEKQFIENIHYTSGGESIPTQFLIELYERIVSSEIKFLREEMLLPDAIKMGHCFLHSKGSKWHNRWLVLSNNHLLIFKKPSETKPLFGISLINCAIGPIGQEKSKQFCIRLHLPNNDSRKLQFILLGFRTGQELNKWMNVIQHHIVIDETLYV